MSVDPSSYDTMVRKLAETIALSTDEAAAAMERLAETLRRPEPELGKPRPEIGGTERRKLRRAAERRAAKAARR